MKSVLITGVSTGIGRDATRELLEHGYQVFGSVRKEKDAAELQAQFGPQFKPLLFDVTDEAAIQRAVPVVAQALNGQLLAGLVNNAGIAVAGPLMHLPIADFRQQFEVNLVGLLAVTQAFLPLLGAKLPRQERPGRIINISSVSGKIAYPFFGPYSSSKHALEALSDVLRRELNIYGIEVITIEPGSIRTPIWDKADQADTGRYVHTDYAPILQPLQKLFVERGRNGLPVELVSTAIRQALEAPRPKTRYALPSHWLTGWLIPRLLPDRWLDRIMINRLGLKKL